MASKTSLSRAGAALTFAVLLGRTFFGCGGSPICGDGDLDDPEECDDGNRRNGDGCSEVCRLEVCGNGILDPGEACDSKDLEPNDCSPLCTKEFCGDGLCTNGETCETCVADCGCADGCCLKGSCQPGNDLQGVCGPVGGLCKVCDSTQVCVGRLCQVRDSMSLVVIAFSADITPCSTPDAICPAWDDPNNNPDAFVVISVPGGSGGKTSVIDGSLTPLWNEALVQAPITALKNGFTVQILDDDSGQVIPNPDDLIAKWTVNLTDNDIAAGGITLTQSDGGTHVTTLLLQFF